MPVNGPVRIALARIAPPRNLAIAQEALETGVGRLSFPPVSYTEV
jgi:hypothetical protein